METETATTTTRYYVALDGGGEPAVWDGSGPTGHRLPKCVAHLRPKGGGLDFGRGTYPTPAELRLICDAIDRWEEADGWDDYDDCADDPSTCPASDPHGEW